MIEVHRAPTDKDRITMIMTEGEEVLCIASAKIQDTAAELAFIDERIPGLAYDMGKSLLNAIDLEGIPTVTADLPDFEDVLKRLRFQKIDGVYTLELAGYFDAGCNK